MIRRTITKNYLHKAFCTFRSPYCINWNADDADIADFCGFSLYSFHFLAHKKCIKKLILHCTKYIQILTLILLLFLSNFTFAQEKKWVTDDAIPGEVIVMLRPDMDIKTFLANFNHAKSTFDPIIAAEKLGNIHLIYLLHFQPIKQKSTQLLAALQQNPAVLAAQFNYPVEFRTEPNDPQYEKQWGLNRIQAPEVWNATTGGLTARGDTIVAAILDNGFDIQHEDLKANIWQNRFEIPNDGLDNDNNGFVDDINGWDFINNRNQHPRSAHGTSVMGILGAKGDNNLGVTGINWNIKIMPLSTSRVSEIIAAYEYIIEQRKLYNETKGAQGAFVVATNASFGQERRFCKEQPVWGMMYDLLGEQGVLTGAGTVNVNYNVDEVGDMPTSCPSDFIITCLNITTADKVSSSSGFGKVAIDVGVPGDGSYSTQPFDNYGSFSQNSAAAPHLTGAIALLYSLPCEALAAEALAQPKATALIIRDAILKGAQPLAALQDKTATGGVLNVFRSLQQLETRCEAITGDLAVLNLYPNPVYDELIIEYETPDFESYSLRIFNTLGQLMYQEDVMPPRFLFKRTAIDVQNWATGFYFLVLEKGKQRVQRKFVVHGR